MKSIRQKHSKHYRGDEEYTLKIKINLGKGIDRGVRHVITTPRETGAPPSQSSNVGHMYAIISSDLELAE